ncbi:D-alanyl-D-alanine carboxypeptidase [Halobacteriovorax sp. GB3]|uniref:D-alanyl-D-alanine carboxypeptidase n=1 Tax=Halobacteriovorax sp. GB3 TaxID=2719615 RepID=UPI00236096B1|nr:D-alanyl-D-alanine carboxypeptidase [Halobacteriovorax sp. GB3]MDD0853198.1 D-alanyl-D-alanine carboxypeptidase [Halobacteriovorax sp. GB3]
MMMSKALILASLLTGLTIGTVSADQSKYAQIYDDYDLTPKYHGFCYTDDKGEIKGLNPHRRVRLASVSKLITTLWATEKMGIDSHYTTKFYHHDNDIHIEGDGDMLNTKRKLFFFLSQLNNLGIQEIDTLSFNKDFFAFTGHVVEKKDRSLSYATQMKVVTGAEGYVGWIFNTSKERTAMNLKYFFNTDTWEKMQEAYKAFINETPKEIIEKLQIKTSLDEISLKVKKVEYKDENPFKDMPEALKTYTHISPELARYLKYMNIKSNNFIADQVFDQLGGEKEFDKYITPVIEEIYPEYEKTRKEFDKGESTIKLFTGSGLNTKRNKKRVDNYSTCAVVVKLIERLDLKLKEIERHIKEVVAVPGSDGGTFKKRLNTPRLTNTMVAKTGTLFHTSALAGKVYSQKGEHFFGVFHQLRGWKGNAKMAQNELVSQIIDEYGGPKKIEYANEFFFPVDQLMK